MEKVERALPTVRFTLRDLDEIIRKTEAESRSKEAERLKRLRAEIVNGEGPKKAMSGPPTEREYLTQKLREATIEYGPGLECMICHREFDLLISGTCEACFEEWMLSVRSLF